MCVDRIFQQKKGAHNQIECLKKFESKTKKNSNVKKKSRIFIFFQIFIQWDKKQRESLKKWNSYRNLYKKKMNLNLKVLLANFLVCLLMNDIINVIVLFGSGFLQFWFSLSFFVFDVSNQIKGIYKCQSCNVFYLILSNLTN